MSRKRNQQILGLLFNPIKSLAQGFGQVSKSQVGTGYQGEVQCHP